MGSFGLNAEPQVFNIFLVHLIRDRHLEYLAKLAIFNTIGAIFEGYMLRFLLFYELKGIITLLSLTA